MPNCFQLTRKGDTHPSPLVLIDDLMCEHFGVDPDPVKYYYGWYDCIGFRLAMGKTFAEIIEQFNEYIAESRSSEYYVVMIEIAKWLDANYTTDAWREIGRR